jgi:hypothetical protein
MRSDTGDRLGKLLALLASDNDGEALAALRAANLLMRALGVSWNDIAQELISRARHEQQDRNRRRAATLLRSNDDWLTAGRRASLNAIRHPRQSKRDPYKDKRRP